MNDGGATLPTREATKYDGGAKTNAISHARPNEAHGTDGCQFDVLIHKLHFCVHIMQPAQNAFGFWKCTTELLVKLKLLGLQLNITV